MLRRLTFSSLAQAAIFFVGAHAQTPTSPQRTILTTPSSVHSEADQVLPAAASASTDTALEKYREMWRKMTPTQQKAFLDSGGYTPEQYERQLRGNAPGAGAGRNAKPGGGVDPTMDSLTRSLQNLDTIRDANLGRVQNQSCPPEVAARVQDLKAKLQSYETNAGGEISAAPTRTREATPPLDPVAIANDWFKPAATEVRSGTSIQVERLANVLPRAATTPRETHKDDQEIARARAELEQLSGACSTVAR
jgi:hypothetical protein